MATLRRFEPVVLTTKEELLVALRTGDIKTSKYNLLNEEQKLFVEMIVFGGYSAEEAIRVIRPKANSYKALANRWTALPSVADTLEELSMAKDRKFMAEVSNSRDIALSKLQFIMLNTEDESLAAVCAKTILDKAERAIATKENNDTAAAGFRFAIELAKEVNRSSAYDGDEPIIVDANPVIVVDAVEPETQSNGLKYALNYEAVDNYTEDYNEPE